MVTITDAFESPVNKIKVLENTNLPAQTLHSLRMLQ